MDTGQRAATGNRPELYIVNRPLDSGHSVPG